MRTTFVLAPFVLITVILLGWGAVSRRWVINDYGPEGSGPLGWSCTDEDRLCPPGLEGEQSNVRLVDVANHFRPTKDPASSRFWIAGDAVAALVATAALALVVALVMRIRWPGWIALAAILLAIVAAWIHLANHPFDYPGLAETHHGLAVYLFHVGIVFGVPTSALLGSLKRR